MAMQLNRDWAYLFLVGATMVIGTCVSTFIQKSNTLEHTEAGVFLGANWLLAATLGWIGCRRLRELKRDCPDESWLKFLRHPLIMTVVMVAVMAGVAVTPEAWLKDAWDFFHEVELFRMLARGGH